MELNKKNLETAARWYKEVDIYIEKSVSEEDKETSLHEEEKENHEEAEGGNVKFTPNKTSARILICPRREHLCWHTTSTHFCDHHNLCN